MYMYMEPVMSSASVLILLLLLVCVAVIIGIRDDARRVHSPDGFSPGPGGGRSHVWPVHIGAARLSRSRSRRRSA
jgi:hypothetical protein